MDFTKIETNKTNEGKKKEKKRKGNEMAYPPSSQSLTTEGDWK